MSDKQTLAVAERPQRGKQNRVLRREGQIPAVVYGHGVDSLPVTVDSREFERALNIAGGNQIVGLKIGDARQKNVIIHDVQRSARTGRVTHADLYVVKMNEKLKTEVPLVIVGESAAVTQEKGTLIKGLDVVEIEALPADLPESIEVDVSVLADFDAVIHVSDLPIPSGVEILTDAEETVAKVEAPRSDEEMAELDEPVVEGEVAVAGDDSEAAAEGGEATEGEDKPAE